MSGFLPAFLSRLICYNNVFLLFTALHNNHLFLLTEVGGMPAVHLVQKKSEITFLGALPGPGDQSLG